MYRLIPMRVIRHTSGAKFDEMIPSDIPFIHGINRVIHAPNSISPEPVEDCTQPVNRPWYMHPGQDDNLIVVQGTRYVDIYDPKIRKKESFIVTPDKIYKNNKLYYDGPVMVVWPAGIYHRNISGDEGSISINFSTRTNQFDFKTNFNVYDLCIMSGRFNLIKDGEDDQPDFTYVYPSEEIKELVEIA